jgi:hypothetical protein
MVAAIGTGDAFAKGRDFAAWLGLVPKQMNVEPLKTLWSVEPIKEPFAHKTAPATH